MMKNLLLSRSSMRTALFCASVSVLAFACKKVDNAIPSAGGPETASPKFKTANTVSSLHPFKVMSFNIRNGKSTSPDPNELSIQQRIPLIINTVSDNSPDAVGFQEFENTADKTVMSTIDGQMLNMGYAKAFTFNMSGTSAPKIIYYKTARFTLVKGERFELNSSGRSGGYAILTDKQNSKQYFIVNSHWENLSAATRLINAHALNDSINAFNTTHLPIVCFGDFNAQPGTTEVNFIKSAQDFTDALGDSTGDVTYNDWGGTHTSKIDWIMSSRDLAFMSPNVITTKYSGHYASDHWAVTATFVPALFKDPVEDANGYSEGTTTRYAFADVNGDGKMDKIYWNANVSSGAPKVFLSSGNGQYAAAVAHTAGASTSQDTYYYYADVNGDGKADEIVWNNAVASGHTRVFLATTGGNFSSTAIDNPEGYSAGTTTIYNFADVNGDGKADKIYWNANVQSGQTKVFLATSGGSFSSSAITEAAGASTTADTRFYYADVNGDGKADKILWHPSLNSGKTMVYLSDGDGTFTASSSFSTAAPSGDADTRFYFADVDGDGRADKIYWRYNVFQGIVKVYLSQTNSTFDGPIYSLRGTGTTAPTQFFFADITGDGKADQIRWHYQQNEGKLRSYAAN